METASAYTSWELVFNWRQQAQSAVIIQSLRLVDEGTHREQESSA